MKFPTSENEWISLISTSKNPLHSIQERNEKIKEEEEKEEEEGNSNGLVIWTENQNLLLTNCLLFS
jgi:hypothetical protein